MVTHQKILPWKIVIIFHIRKETNEYNFETSFWLNTPTKNASTYIILKEIQRGFDSMWAIPSDLPSLNVSHTYLLFIFMFVKCVPKPFRIKSTIVPRAPAKESQWEGLSLLFGRSNRVRSWHRNGRIIQLKLKSLSLISWTWTSHFWSSSRLLFPKTLILSRWTGKLVKISLIFKVEGAKNLIHLV